MDKPLYIPIDVHKLPVGRYKFESTIQYDGKKVTLDDLSLLACKTGETPHMTFLDYLDKNPGVDLAFIVLVTVGVHLIFRLLRRFGIV